MHMNSLIGAVCLGAVTAWAAMTMGAADASAQARPKTSPEPRAQHVPTPVLAVVSLGDQRISVYDANGRILQSPISSGATGLETPAGVFSIVQKKPEHYSNIYGDASMPFMERITWTGIALHAGVLPGYPASHGCVRLPLAFAEQLFGITKLGMRVILVPSDIKPEDFSHPALFKPEPARVDMVAQRLPTSRPMTRASYRAAPLPISRLGPFAAENVLTPSPVAQKYMGALAAVASTKQQEAVAAVKRATELKQVAIRKAAEAEQAARLVKAAEANLARLQDQLKAAERTLEAAKTPETSLAAEAIKTKAVAAVVEGEKQLGVVKAQSQPKIEAGAMAADEARAAETAREDALEAAEVASRRLSPVSVLVSRKMRRLYVRQANLPLMEAPITIRNPDEPIGTFVFTAMDFTNEKLDDMRWSVVSMYKSLADMPKDPPPQREPAPEGTPVRPLPVAARKPVNPEAFPADLVGAKAALERVAFPQDIVAQVAPLMVPGSSLIISDEGISIETGKDTDFVLIMSNEPQGSLKTRKREAPPRPRDENNIYSSGLTKNLPAFAQQLGWGSGG